MKIGQDELFLTWLFLIVFPLIPALGIIFPFIQRIQKRDRKYLFIKWLFFETAACLLLLYRYPLENFGFKKTFIFQDILDGVVLFIMLEVIYWLLSTFAEKFFAKENWDYFLPKNRTQTVLWFVLLISSGIWEEIIFRGFILNRLLLQGVSIPFSVFLVTVSFVMMHGYKQGACGFIWRTGFGLFLSCFFIREHHNILPNIIAHCLFNLAAIIRCYFMTIFQRLEFPIKKI